MKHREDEHVNDDDLITEEEKTSVLSLFTPIRKTAKRSCAGCTCGAKEAEAVSASASATDSATVTDSNNANPKSECGNCYLGDAFRCNSCPYNGMPPFKINEPVTFDSNDMF
ncbi:hypothetical protein NEDG_00737 [Nematocida displodere]|uniref:Anamorsin C-terminal domain-containing protein n=1 Tax=Nematocida displodere TaxID=1805483 RepID=A0A177ECC8_9MICR|nr:hypothetical protein NEDG_00737 [Nematocida displodere]